MNINVCFPLCLKPVYVFFFYSLPPILLFGDKTCARIHYKSRKSPIPSQGSSTLLAWNCPLTLFFFIFFFLLSAFPSAEFYYAHLKTKTSINSLLPLIGIYAKSMTACIYAASGNMGLLRSKIFCLFLLFINVVFLSRNSFTHAH